MAPRTPCQNFGVGPLVSETHRVGPLISRGVVSSKAHRIRREIRGSEGTKANWCGQAAAVRRGVGGSGRRKARRRVHNSLI